MAITIPQELNIANAPGTGTIGVGVAVVKEATDSADGIIMYLCRTNEGDGDTCYVATRWVSNAGIFGAVIETLEFPIAGGDPTWADSYGGLIRTVEGYYLAAISDYAEIPIGTYMVSLTVDEATGTGITEVSRTRIGYRAFNLAINPAQAGFYLIGLRTVVPGNAAYLVVIHLDEDGVVTLTDTINFGGYFTWGECPYHLGNGIVVFGYSSTIYTYQLSASGTLSLITSKNMGYPCGRIVGPLTNPSGYACIMLIAYQSGNDCGFWTFDMSLDGTTLGAKIDMQMISTEGYYCWGVFGGYDSANSKTRYASFQSGQVIGTDYPAYDLYVSNAGIITIGGRAAGGQNAVPIADGARPLRTYVDTGVTYKIWVVGCELSDTSYRRLYTAKLAVHAQRLPTITNVTPGSGFRGDVLEVVITGTNFLSVQVVYFGAGIVVSSWVVDSSTQITAQITISEFASIGSRDVSVTTVEGIGTLEDGFSVSGNTHLITNIIHRYDRMNRIYNLELVIGGVTSEFGMPEWTTRPVPMIKNEPDPAVVEEVKKQVNAPTVWGGPSGEIRELTPEDLARPGTYLSDKDKGNKLWQTLTPWKESGGQTVGVYKDFTENVAKKAWQAITPWDDSPKVAKLSNKAEEVFQREFGLSSKQVQKYLNAGLTLDDIRAQFGKEKNP